MRFRTYRHRGAAIAIWAGLAGLMLGPVVIAAFSPFLAYRNFAYILGGFAGIACLSLLLIQPLLAAGYLPGLTPASARRWHRRIGTAIVLGLALHIAGLFVTSPPDTLDALLLVAPTPFSVYGVLAMWGVFATALLVLFRHGLGIGDPAWRIVHNALALQVVIATIIHAVQIEGAMGTVSKWLLCLAVLTTSCVTVLHIRLIRPLRQRRKTRARARARSGQL